jgi:hypothetical protein
LNGVLTSVFDAANNLTSRQFGGSGQTTLCIDLTYTPRNQIATINRWKDLAGTQAAGSSAYSHDGDQRLTQLQHKNASGGNIANYTYSYDLASRLTQEQDNGTSTTYGYDSTSELTNAGSVTYSYDFNGNRTLTGYQTGTANELSKDGTWTYSYDNEGNITKKTKGTSAETWYYGYDNRNNHLTSAMQEQTDGGTLLMQATYVYDALGNRVEKDVWTSTGGLTVTRFGYDQGNVWADLTAAISCRCADFTWTLSIPSLPGSRRAAPRLGICRTTWARSAISRTMAGRQPSIMWITMPLATSPTRRRPATATGISGPGGSSILKLDNNITVLAITILQSVAGRRRTRLDSDPLM